MTQLLEALKIVYVNQWFPSITSFIQVLTHSSGLFCFQTASHCFEGEQWSYVTRPAVTGGTSPCVISGSCLFCSWSQTVSLNWPMNHAVTMAGR